MFIRYYDSLEPTLPTEQEDFPRWLSLFHETVDELFKGDKAENAKDMAAKIASSFAVRMDMEKNKHKYH